MSGTGSRKLIWVDITNAPHVLVLKPIIEVLESRGHEVVITARDFSQTISLLERFELEHHNIGAHRGKSIARKMLGLFNRTSRLMSFVKENRFKFDLALSHGSNDLAVAARLLGIPHVTMFDYEYATVAHHINFRLSKKVMCPKVIDKAILRKYSWKDKLDQYEGLKEEYYLSGWQPDETVIQQLALDNKRPIAVVRTPPDLALYHRFENNLFDSVIKNLDALDIQVVVLPRTGSQRETLRAMDTKNVIIPEHAIDAQSLVFFADVMISAGGTMNREAAVLGTPVYTVFSGKLGAVDKELIDNGLMFKLDSSDQVIVSKDKNKTISTMNNLKDPALLVDRILAVSK